MTTPIEDLAATANPSEMGVVSSHVTSWVDGPDGKRHYNRALTRQRDDLAKRVAELAAALLKAYQSLLFDRADGARETVADELRAVLAQPERGGGTP